MKLFSGSYYMMVEFEHPSNYLGIVSLSAEYDLFKEKAEVNLPAHFFRHSIDSGKNY